MSALTFVCSVSHYFSNMCGGNVCVREIMLCVYVIVGFITNSVRVHVCQFMSFHFWARVHSNEPSHSVDRRARVVLTASLPCVLKELWFTAAQVSFSYDWRELVRLISAFTKEEVFTQGMSLGFQQRWLINIFTQIHCDWLCCSWVSYEVISMIGGGSEWDLQARKKERLTNSWYVPFPDTIHLLNDMQSASENRFVINHTNKPHRDHIWDIIIYLQGVFHFSLL